MGAVYLTGRGVCTQATSAKGTGGGPNRAREAPRGDDAEGVAGATAWQSEKVEQRKKRGQKQKQRKKEKRKLKKRKIAVDES